MSGVPSLRRAAVPGGITKVSSREPVASGANAAQASAASVSATLRDEFRRELEDRDIDDIAVMENVVIVTVVGAGMRHTPGISGRVFGALGAEQLNIIAIAQGSSECSISMIVDKQDADAAVRAIHRLIVNGG